jgi:hypothetical protein
MSRCTKCSRGGVHGHAKHHPHKRSKRGVHGIGKITESDWKDFGYNFFVHTGLFLASRAMFNPMFGAMFKDNIGRKEKWVKYVPGTFKALSGFFWYTHADSAIQKMAATALFGMGIQETIAATNKDLFATPGANFFNFLPKDEITPLLYGPAEAVSGFDDYDGLHGAPVLYLEDGVHGLEDLSELEHISGMDGAITVLAGLF